MSLLRLETARRPALLLAICLALASAACATGALGQSVTQEADGSGERLNAPLAIGATYRPEVHVDTKGSATPSIRLMSTRPNVVGVSNGQLIGRSRGVAAILFTTADSTVVDFLHVWVERPTHVALHRLSPSGSDLGEVRDRVDLLVGDSIWLSPRVYADAQHLAGSITSEWKVDPPIARVLRDGVYKQRRLVADSPGTATLTVSLSGVTAQASIVVQPTSAPAVAAPPPPPPPAPEPGLSVPPEPKAPATPQGGAE